MKTLIYSNEWFSGAHYIKHGGHYPLALYGMLQYFEHNNKCVCINLDMIINFLELKDTRENQTKLKNALKYLDEIGLVELYKNITFKEKVVFNIDNIKTKSNLYIKLVNFPDKRFTIIRDTELISILTDTENRPNTKVEMYALFCSIMSHINHESKTSYPAHSTLNEEACVGKESTCTVHTRRLKALGVMIYENVGYKNSKDGVVSSNVYARPEHQFELDEHMNSKRKNHRTYVFKDRLRDITVKKQSISTTLRHRTNEKQMYIDNGEPIPPSLEQEIIDLLVAHSALDMERETYRLQVYDN